MIRPASLLLVAAACTVGTVLAAPVEREHRVARGESASALAKRYYGDIDLAPLLLAYNGKQGTVLQVGETLRIPGCPVHEVRAGDTGSVLSRRYLGRPEAWPSVARLNGLAPGQALRVGRSLVFPVIVRHELRRGETLAVLAARFYGDPHRGDLLREFNAIDDPRTLAVGQSVEVPLVTLRLVDGASRAARPAPEQPPRTVEEESPHTVQAKPTPDGPRPVPESIPAAATVDSRESVAQAPPPDLPPPVPEASPSPSPEPGRYAEPLAEASAALAHGRYEEVRERLEALREPVSTTRRLEDRVVLWKLLLALHVAYDEAGEACAAYRSLAALDAAAEANPDIVSPKVRETIEHCSVR